MPERMSVMPSVSIGRREDAWVASVLIPVETARATDDIAEGNRGVANLEIRQAVQRDRSGDGDAATAAAVHAEEVQPGVSSSTNEVLSR